MDEARRHIEGGRFEQLRLALLPAQNEVHSERVWIRHGGRRRQLWPVATGAVL
jgi:hypothetical protein